MTNTIDNTGDVIDSRDVIARIEELESLKADHESDPTGGHFSDEDALELRDLRAFANEAIHYSDDWEYGATLIRDSYFVDYIRELIDDCYELPKPAKSDAWPYRYLVMDYDAAANDAKVDYTPVDFGGVTYWVR